jgi:excisionase family DNA binding protein
VRAVSALRATESMEQLWTVRDVAHYLNCSPQAVYQWAARRELPCLQVGTLRRFRRSDVDAWLEARSARSVALLRLRRPTGRN